MSVQHYDFDTRRCDLCDGDTMQRRVRGTEPWECRHPQHGKPAPAPSARPIEPAKSVETRLAEALISLELTQARLEQATRRVKSSRPASPP